MKRITLFIAVFVLLGVSGGSLSAKIPEPKLKSAPVASSRDGQSPYIQYLKGSFGGPYYSDGWFWVHPGQTFRIYWKAGDVRWCNKWSNDPSFTGRAHARGEYWTRLDGPNFNSAIGAWVFGLTCGNGVSPNAAVRIWVKVV